MTPITLQTVIAFEHLSATFMLDETERHIIEGQMTDWLRRQKNTGDLIWFTTFWKGDEFGISFVAVDANPSAYACSCVFDHLRYSDIAIVDSPNDAYDRAMKGIG